MSFSFRCHRLGCNPLGRESRLLQFGRFDKGTDRTKEVNDARNTIEDERAKRVERTGELSDRLNAKRLNAPAVDPNRGQELLEAERETVLLGDMPDTPRYRGLQLKVEKVEKICASRKTIQGIQFGYNGQEFTLISADEDFVQKALLHVAEEISELRRSDDRPELRLPQAPGEPDEDYAERIKTVEKSSKTAKELGRNRKSEDAEQWAMLYGALRKYKSEFDGFKQILAMLDKDPKAINKVTDKWKKENPASYTKALKDAAKKDASVLMGKEKEFSDAAFLQIIDEAVVEQPMSLRYYPDALKRTPDGAQRYRTLMIREAARDADLLAIASTEFDRVWKGNDADFAVLVQASLLQRPALILEPSLWKKGANPPNFRDLLAAFDSTDKLKVLKSITRKNADALGVDFPMTFTKDIYDIDPDRTILTVVQNAHLLSILQERDRAFFDRIVEEFFTKLTEDEQRQAQDLPHFERMRAYALHTLRIHLGAALLGDKDPHRMVRNLNADPALREWTAVKAEWIKEIIKDTLTPQQEAQWRAMVTRNLFFTGRAVTRENVLSECARIRDQRAKYKDVSLFQGREVLHVAHSELRDTKAKTHRFGSESLKEAIRSQSTKDRYAFIRPEMTKESLKKAKEDILLKIVSAGHPFTFVFEGHASPDAIYLSDGQVIDDTHVHETPDTIRISVTELAAALRLRGEKYRPDVGDPVDPRRRDILILGSCFNADFLRSLHDRLGDAPKPIVLGESEYGQYGYDQESNTLGSHFFSDVLQLKKTKDGHISTFGDVFEHELEGSTNPSIYAPDERNATQQVTEVDREPREDTIA